MGKLPFLVMVVVFFLVVGCSSAVNLSYDEICDASKMIGNYTALEGRIPAQVNINGKSVSADDYLYASSSMILNLNQAKKPGLSFNSMGSAPNPAGTATGTLTKDQYLQVAQNIKNFMETNGRSPNYASTSIGSVRYEALIYAHARIINFYNSTGRLPNQVTIYQITGKTGTLTRPKADYNYKIEGCSVQFQDKSTGSIQVWAWNLGDGTTSTKRNPEHTYKPGTYNVTLTVKGHGVTDSKTAILDVMVAVVHVNSTATSPWGPLNLTFKVPLNDTVKWLSIGSSATGLFNETIFLVEDGIPYKLAEVTNPFYQANRQSQREIVWKAMAGLNRLIEIYAKLGAEPRIDEYLNNFNLTQQEKTFILTNYNKCTDPLHVSVEYPGEESVTIANITFPGNKSKRTLVLLYTNGQYIHPPGQETGPNTIIEDTLTWEASDYDTIITYTLATGKITNQTLEKWLNQQYPPGPLKAAYGTFLTGLELIYLHDKIAEEAAKAYNVTWTRTKPVMVSTGDHSPGTWISLECNHNMGVEAQGTPENVRAFNYARTSAINPVEYYVMGALFPGSDPMGAPMTGIGQTLLQGTPVSILEGENYTIITDEHRKVIIDHTTGIVRDIIHNLMGAYCYYHQQTEWAQELANELLNGSGWWKFIGVGAITAAEAAIFETGVLSAPETLGLSIAIAVVAIALYEHPEWLPYFEDAALAIILSPGGLPTFICYSLLTGDTQTLQEYLQILSKKIKSGGLYIDPKELEEKINELPSGGVGETPDPEDVVRKLMEFIVEEGKLFKEAVENGDLVGAIKHGVMLGGAGMTVVSYILYEEREPIEACILGLKNYVKKKLEEIGSPHT